MNSLPEHALKGEGLGDDAHGQDAQIVCHLSHNRSRTRAGAAAHTGGDKDHLGALQGICDLVLAFLGSTLADLGISARAAALGKLGAQLQTPIPSLEGLYTGRCTTAAYQGGLF